MPASLPSVWLQDLTWEEVAAYGTRDRIILVPIGSTEQHGPAGVLGVDTYSAIALCEAAAEQGSVLCAPPLWYGDSLHHGAFAGTVSLRPDTLTLVVRDVCRSLARHGFDRIVLVNGHKGSNLPALTSAVRVLHEEELPEVLFAIADPLHLARSAAPGIKESREHHAGELELSHIYFRFPEKVRMDRLTDAQADFGAVFGGFVGDDLFGPAPDGVDIVWSSDEQRVFAPTGSLASSTGVAASKGQAYHDHCVGRLTELIAWLRSYDGPIGKGNRE